MIRCNTCGGTTVFVSSGIVKCEYCGKLYSTSNGKLNLADPERLYNSAVSMAKSQNEETLKSAIETFEALGSYKDSSALANSCRGMIAQSRVEAEERHLAVERQEELERIEREKRAVEDKQKAKIRGIVIATVSVVAIIAVTIGVISNSNKLASYNKAMELYSGRQYEEARAVFVDLGDYSDAASYVSTIDNFLTERESKYEKGIGYYEKGAYSECIASLADISDYLDSESYIEKSVEAIYQQATEHYDVGEYEKAKELLEKIPDSSSKSMDAELLLADIEAIIIEQTNAANYEQAKVYYDKGDYETAQRLFMSLGSYEDSAVYLSAIGTSYYEQASYLFDQKEYIQCGDVLQYIDTAEEWAEYALAVELKGTVVDTYKECVAIEAKNICRSEGYSAMVAYVNEKICNILSNDEANILKESCTVKVISLSDLIPYYKMGRGVSSETDVKDTMANTYSYALRGDKSEVPWTSFEESSWTYDIGGEYCFFTATVAVSGTSGQTFKNGKIKIYGDNVLLWSNETIAVNTKPYPIQVDISGVTDLKFELYGCGTATTAQGTVLLGNPMLSE